MDTATVSGQLLNAAPGLFFAVGGLVGLIVSIVKGVMLDFRDGTMQGLQAEDDY